MFWGVMSEMAWMWQHLVREWMGAQDASALESGLGQEAFEESKLPMCL